MENGDRASKALTVIERQRQALQKMSTAELSTQIPPWKDRTIRMLSDLIVKDELALFAKINTDNWGKDRAAYVGFLSDLVTGIRELPDHYLPPVALPPISKLVSNSATNPAPTAASRAVSGSVFIVHGHDSMAKLELARTLEKLKLSAIVLHEQPNEGKTIIEKFERDASRVSFAVVLLTPDDIGYPQGKPDEAKPRSRQNVVLELGFFSGALGRSNVCVLYKGDVEIPSDYLGVVYVNMDANGAWRFELAKELKQAGLPVDLNHLI